MVGVDTQLDVARRRGIAVEQVPPPVAVDLDAGDGARAARPLDLADVAHLAAATRVERRTGQHHRAGPGVDHRRLVDVQVRLLMTEIDRHDDRVDNAVRVSRGQSAAESYDRRIRARSRVRAI